MSDWVVSQKLEYEREVNRLRAENQRLREHIEESLCDCLDVYDEFCRVPCKRCMLVATWGGPTSAHPGLTAVQSRRQTLG